MQTQLVLMFMRLKKSIQNEIIHTYLHTYIQKRVNN